MGHCIESLRKRSPLPSPGYINHSGKLQRKCDTCRDIQERNKKNQFLFNPQSTCSIPPIVHDVLQSPGHALDPVTRAYMEPRFGYDFSRVRVHTDEKAASSAQAINAQAYTLGQNVVFGGGQYAPDTSAGNRLLAHELTHTLQQKNTRSGKGFIENFSQSIDAPEIEANKAVQSVMQGFPSIITETDPGTISRQTPDAGSPDAGNPPLRDAGLPGGVANPPTPTPVPTPFVCPSNQWPPNNWHPAAPPRYAGLDPVLLGKLMDSYSHHNTDRTFLANAFYSSDPNCPALWPRTIWDALDLLGSVNNDVVNQVAIRAGNYSDIWQKVERIRNIWRTSSEGFDFFTSDEPGLQSNLIANSHFCRDKKITEWWYHSGMSCWRETGRLGRRGLHICLGAGLSPTIHNDFQQIAKRRDPDGSCNISYWSWLGHARDVVSQ